ncbi:MAG: hypothetical protein IPN26_05390 [Bacteroidetes bacterium]|nr:hypothetical protein [Bacteroidota bacterium]
MRTLLLALGWMICCALSAHHEAITWRIPAQWPAMVYDTSQNRLSEQKIFLGRVLFYDPLLSRNHQVSCASCHSPYSAFYPCRSCLEPWRRRSDRDPQRARFVELSLAK